MTYQQKIDALVDLGIEKFSTWETEFMSDMIEILEESDDEDTILTTNQKEKIDELYDKHFGD